MDASENNIIKYFASKAIDMHCHGVGRFDFTEIPDVNLQQIEEILAIKQRHSILTLYLPYVHFENFLNLMESYYEGKSSGAYKHIVGIGLEGPLLASHGGTPHKGVWNPTKREWKRLANCGEKGLVYSICSPDAYVDKCASASLDSPANSIEWITETLLEGGVLPAAGHFNKDNPIDVANRLQAVYNIVDLWGHGPTITDHMYNDMPHNFIHAWRTPAEKARREQELKQVDIESWTLDNIEEKLGAVPATIIRNAKRGIVKISQNFDGEHVDLAIVKKTVELVGAENMMMMTDSIESKRLAGRDLHLCEGSSLLYQDEGIVAAGSRGIYQQIENMLEIGLTNNEIDLITNKVPRQVLQKRNAYIKSLTRTEEAEVIGV